MSRKFINENKDGITVAKDTASLTGAILSACGAAVALAGGIVQLVNKCKKSKKAKTEKPSEEQTDSTSEEANS